MKRLQCLMGLRMVGLLSLFVTSAFSMTTEVLVTYPGDTEKIFSRRA